MSIVPPAPTAASSASTTPAAPPATGPDRAQRRVHHQHVAAAHPEAREVGGDLVDGAGDAFHHADPVVIRRAAHGVLPGADDGYGRDMPKHTTSQLTAEFSIDEWDEQPLVEDTGSGKLTRAVVGKTYTGDVKGHSTTEWVMAYAADGSATFVGMERPSTGRSVADGAAWCCATSAPTPTVASAELTIAPGSGAGDLAGVEGTGELRADPAGKVSLHVSTG